MFDKRCIVAMGGGGFSMEPDNLALDRYILEQSAAVRPAVCFLATASGDSREHIDRFYAAYGALAAEPSHLSLFNYNVSDPRKHLLDQDVIYVGGGSVFNLLTLWRAHGLVDVLREAWHRGIVLAGLSAGSICWYQSGVTDSFGLPLRSIDTGLGFLSGSHCPHYDGEAERRPAFEALIASGELSPGIAADDGVALRYRGTELVEIVTSRPNKSAYQVGVGVAGVTTQVLSARSLVS